MNSSPRRSFFGRERIVGIVFVGLGLGGLLQTIFGAYSAGAGVGAHLLPRIAFLIVLGAGVFLLADPRPGAAPQGQMAAVGITSVLVFTGAGFLHFLAVLRIGLVVSTLLYSLFMFALLTSRPLKNWKQVVVPSIVITALVWGGFTWLLPLVLPRPLLF